MLKSRDKSGLFKKCPPTMDPQPTYHLTDSFRDTSPQKRMQTLQSRYSRDPYLRQAQLGTSSRIANEVEQLPSGYQSFQAEILKKVESIEVQTNQLLQKKQRQLYFIKIELLNSESRLQQVEQILKLRDEQICKLQYQLQSKGKSPYSYLQSNSQQYRFVEEENEKLKESLRILIEEKNQNWKYHQGRGEVVNNQKVNSLRQEVEQLRAMVVEMQKLVFNCPSCFTLRRNIEQLSQAYGCLLKEHSDVKKLRQNKQKDLLKSITHKIEENQNILRENNHLRSQKQGKPYLLRPKREKLKESVAKRCRTLTDNF